MTGAPEAGSGRRRLTSADILHAGIALVDTDGVGQLTMRRLGAALGVEAMALYHHFPSRQVLLDALVESIVTEVATDPATQMVPGDDWRDYLHRLAHGVRRMALTHPRAFPLVATHPTEAPWIRPPIRSLRWVEAFLQGLQDHHFPPPAAVSAYKQFSTFLLGHLLLEVSSLGLEHPPEASAPPPPPDPDKRAAEDLRVERAEQADEVMTGGTAPSAAQILDAAATRPPLVLDQPAVQATDAAGTATAHRPPAGPTAPPAADVDLPVVAVVVSTAALDLSRFRLVSASAGLLARDTAAADFDRDLTRLLDDLAGSRRP